MYSLRNSAARGLGTALAKVMSSARHLSVTSSRETYNRPPQERYWPGGICTLFRLPLQENCTDGLDAAYVGIPMDQGASNRSGTRMGPRQIRTESVIIREFNKETGAAPFQSLKVADIGDVPFAMYDINKAAADIRDTYKGSVKNGCKMLTMGGDHSITYPILQAMAEKYGRVGLIHVDAHKDTDEDMEGCEVAHASPFYRAWEEQLLDNQRVVQIGLRGTGTKLDSNGFGLDLGWRVIPARQCWYKSLAPLMEEVRQQMGDGPVYLSFDIDAIDPAFAPGTGTPEIGGLTTSQALEIIWGCRGLNLVGADLVEVSPPYDPTGTTAIIAANLLFEMLCVLPGVHYGDIPV